MTASPTESTVQEKELLETAKEGSEDAYRRLVEPHRSELHAHCYRMLGSVQDAEDALQEALVRAWRGLPRFEGRSSLRSWLYRIATNTSLDAIERRPKRVLPVDYGPAADPHGGVGEPVVESVWIEPYPDETLGIGERTVRRLLDRFALGRSEFFPTRLLYRLHVALESYCRRGFSGAREGPV